MKRWEKNLYSLWLAQFITSMGLSMILPFLPLYLRDLGVSGAQAEKIWSGLVYSAPFMISAFMQPVWGMLGDRKGRKIMVVRAMAALSLAHILMGFSHSAPPFIILRFFQGSLSGFVAPSLALMASCTPEVMKK
jgi:DHA1 family multidrug resistance protein-like MFS transporter